MIHFSCFHCGLKLKVRPELAGRFARCPTCKQPLVVPTPDAAPLQVPRGQIEGTSSSLGRAGVNAGVTLELFARHRGQQSIDELLAAQGEIRQRYVVGGEIARGGMGAVLRAVDCDIRREVAVKYLLDQSEPAKKLRFIEEAQITGQLEHPNIVPVHELGFDAKQRLFFSMKMVRGRSLAQILDALRSDSPLPPGEGPAVNQVPPLPLGEGPGVRASTGQEYPLSRLLNIFVSVSNAIAYAHSRGVIHRDLKPANIMVGDFGEVYVMDWGLAKVLKDGKGSDRVTPPPAAAPSPARGAALQSFTSRVATSRAADADLTVDGEVLGTPAYMPPEQATGQVQAIDQRSDIYSLGAILYAMLALRPPVDKEGNYAMVLMRVAEGQIRPPEEGNARRVRAGRIPRELSAVAMKALAKRPEDRYQTVEALRQDIERFQEGRSVSAKEDTKWEQFSKLVKRNKGVSAGVAVAVVVLLCSLGVVFKAWWETNRAYAAYQKEQGEKQERTRKAVPAFVAAARLAVDQYHFDEALSEVTLALDYDPDYAAARLLRGQLLLLNKDYAGTRRELETYLARKPQYDAGASLADLWEQKSRDKAVAGLLELCQRKNPDDPATMLAFAQVLQQQKQLALANGLLARYGGTLLEARQAMLAVLAKRIKAAWPAWQLDPAKCNGLGMDDTGLLTLQLADRTEVADLKPLEGMAIKWLRLSGCQNVRGLSPLKGMPLTYLDLRGTGVNDPSPLRGMPLTFLVLGQTGVQDLSPLRGMPLTFLDLVATRVQDLSPLKGMRLTSLNLESCHELTDLSPLAGTPLTSLRLRFCGVRDLSPLQGMPLTSLELGETRVQDLSPLKGMPMTHLDLCNTRVQDLSPLKGMPLTQLHLIGCGGVKDLSPLEGMKLTDIHLPPEVTRGMNVLRRMKSLVTIDGKPADEFWRKYDAAEAKK